MIDKIVNLLFRWKRLREALFIEVNFYNSMTRIINDPEAMKTATAFWDEGDGWRGWTIEDGKYYFNDIPSYDMIDAMQELEEMHAKRPL